MLMPTPKTVSHLIIPKGKSDSNFLEKGVTTPENEVFQTWKRAPPFLEEKIPNLEILMALGSKSSGFWSRIMKIWHKPGWSS